jgi:hypothetical protein
MTVFQGARRDWQSHGNFMAIFIECRAMEMHKLSAEVLHNLGLVSVDVFGNDARSVPDKVTCRGRV